MGTQIIISSTNFLGQIGTITLYPLTGGTVSLGSHQLPYTLDLDYYYGSYDIFFSAYSNTCSFDIDLPPSPTPTNTSTVTPTPSVSPTNTVTPTRTPDVTSTNTPSVTQTNTPSVTSTPSVTPSVTTTSTNTPSVTQTNTPSPTVCVCQSYRLRTFVDSNTFNYRNCDGTTGSTSLGIFSFVDICACQNSVTFGPGDSDVVDNGPCVTPTPTPTNTNTPSVTQTSTQTPSNTATPTLTPTKTPNAVCPEEFVVTNSTSGFFDDGTYTRQYSASGQSMNYGYVFWTGATQYFVIGTAPDGNDYAVFEYYDGVDYNTVAARFGSFGGGNAFNSWYSFEQNPSILSSGSTFVGGSTAIGTGTTIFSGVRYPSAGQKTGGYITYSETCPTSTPTPSVTQTPSNTATPTPSVSPTNTQTPSVTPSSTPPSVSPTSTNTPTVTNTPSPTSTCSICDVIVDNNSLDIPIQAIEFNTVPITYVSGTNFTINAGDPNGNFTSSQLGTTVTIDIDYGSCIAGQNISFTDCDGNPFCCNTNSGGGTCTFTNVSVKGCCTITFVASDGACT